MDELKKQCPGRIVGREHVQSFEAPVVTSSREVGDSGKTKQAHKPKQKDKDATTLVQGALPSLYLCYSRR